MPGGTGERAKPATARRSLSTTGSPALHGVRHHPHAQGVLRDASAREGRRAGRLGSAPSLFPRAGAARSRVLRGGSGLVSDSHPGRPVLGGKSWCDARLTGDHRPSTQPVVPKYLLKDSSPTTDPSSRERSRHKHRQEGNLPVELPFLQRSKGRTHHEAQITPSKFWEKQLG